MNLLAVAHNYRSQDKKVLLFKPAIDDRFGESFIKSRTGLAMQADLLLDNTSEIDPKSLDGVHCILVDEAQFLSTRLINELRQITNKFDIPVICYGLRTDFRTDMFSGSKRLLELADTIEEVKTTCNFCNRKAIYNLKLQNGKATTEGASVELGLEDKYLPACAKCYEQKLRL